MKDKINLRFGIISIMVLVAALSRLLPHPDNVTPIGAMALFGSAYFSRKYLAFLIPFAAMWISDLIMNNLVFARLYPEFYNGFAWFGSTWVYAAFGLIVLLGFWLLKKVSWQRVVGASLLGSVLFFLVTNFAAWMTDPMYTKDLSGLGASYLAGLPFFRNTLFGDLAYCGLLFGAFEYTKSRLPALQTETVKD